MFIKIIEWTLEQASRRPMLKHQPPPLSPQGLKYASFNARMLASTFDAFILMLLIWPFNEWILAFVYQDIHVDPALAQHAIDQAETPAEAQIAVLRLQLQGGLLQALALLTQIQYGLLAAYSVIFWHFYSATPGKMVLGLRIVDAKTGANISNGQSMTRVFAYLLAGLPLMLGFFSIGWSKKRQGWHDLLARTAVVVVPRKKAKSVLQSAPPSDSPGPEAKE